MEIPLQKYYEYLIDLLDCERGKDGKSHVVTASPVTGPTQIIFKSNRTAKVQLILQRNGKQDLGTFNNVMWMH
jgi:hypothetical protein